MRSVPLKLVLLGVDLDVALLNMLVGTMGTLPKPVNLVSYAGQSM